MLLAILGRFWKAKSDGSLRLYFLKTFCIEIYNQKAIGWALRIGRQICNLNNTIVNCIFRLCSFSRLGYKRFPFWRICMNSCTHPALTTKEIKILKSINLRPLILFTFTLSVDDAQTLFAIDISPIRIVEQHIFTPKRYFKHYCILQLIYEIRMSIWLISV